MTRHTVVRVNDYIQTNNGLSGKCMGIDGSVAIIRNATSEFYVPASDTSAYSIIGEGCEEPSFQGLDESSKEVEIEEHPYMSQSGEDYTTDGNLDKDSQRQVVSVLNKKQARSALLRIIDGWNVSRALLNSTTVDGD